MLISLLRFGLFGGENPLSAPLSDADWESIFDEAHNQAVTALVYDAILRLPKELRPSRQQLFHFTSLTQTIESDNRKRAAALRHFAMLMKKELGMQATVVKGTSLARLYPERLHRECGDNDLLTGRDTDKVCQLAESLGLEVDRSDPRHASFRYEEVSFECHSFLLYSPDGSQGHIDDGLDPEWTPIPFEEEQGYTLLRLPDEQEAFFLAKHTEHHAVFFHQPVPLRSVIDWALLVSSPGFDYEKLNDLKSNTDIDRFADLMTLYCVERLNIDIRVDVKVDRLMPEDFERIYLRCPARHRLAVVRFIRRSFKYIRYYRKYKILYGQSMFRRFYLRNICKALHLP